MYIYKFGTIALVRLHNYLTRLEISSKMRPSTLISLLALLTLCSCESPGPKNDITTKTSDFTNPDANLTVPELIIKYGYPFENHTVTTEDGYILTLHRIPHGKNSTTISKKVVFLMHGVMGSSADWILAGPTHALGYILADKGYDVWMGNARGNTYSRKHTTLDPDQDGIDFWYFSWHEIGIYDMPAMIDYVLEITGEKQLHSISFSQGTTTFYVMASTHPEYNQKIKAHFSLAPIAFMSNLKSPFFSNNKSLDEELSSDADNQDLSSFLYIFLSAELSLSSPLFNSEEDCGIDKLSPVKCSNDFFIVTGLNKNELNMTLLPVLATHYPAGTSHFLMFHYIQQINSGHFRPVNRYGPLPPPDYNLSAISTPIYLFYSQNDWLYSETDVDRLCEKIGSNCKEKILVANGTYSHLDYLFGLHATENVYNKIISLMAET